MSRHKLSLVEEEEWKAFVLALSQNKILWKDDRVPSIEEVKRLNGWEACPVEDGR
jgi:hypothetical protein